MLALHKTPSSEFILQLFKAKKALNIAHNKFYFADKLVKEGYDEQTNLQASNNLAQFKSYLKNNKLKLNFFAIGFNHDTNRYSYEYEIQSKIHRTNPLFIQGNFESPVPFGVFPQMFSTFFNRIYKELPFDYLKSISRGG